MLANVILSFFTIRDLLLPVVAFCYQENPIGNPIDYTWVVNPDTTDYIAGQL